jgi:hypothetical protein
VCLPFLFGGKDKRDGKDAKDGKGEGFWLLARDEWDCYIVSIVEAHSDELVKAWRKHFRS